MLAPLLPPSPTSPHGEPRRSKACLRKDAMPTPLFAAEGAPTLPEGPPLSPGLAAPHTRQGPLPVFVKTP